MKRPASGTGRNKFSVPLFRGDKEPLEFFRSIWKPLLAVLVVALIARIAQYFFIKANDPSFACLTQGVDTFTYDSWAMKILDGDWLSRHKPVFYMGPLFAYVLAAVYGIFGHNFAVAHQVHFLLGTASCGMVFLAGIQWFSRRVAFVAALMLALTSSTLFYESTLLPEPLIFFLLSVFLLLLGLTYNHPQRWWLWLITGASLGLASIQRGNTLLCAAGVALWVIVCFPKWKLLKRFGYLGIFLLGVAAAVSPATLHNRLIGGKWVLITSNGPINLYMGNGYGSFGMFGPTPKFDEHSEKLNQTVTLVEELKEQLRKVTETEDSVGAGSLRKQISKLEKQRDNFWRTALVKEILEHPWSWAGLMFRKAYMFWGTFDIPDNYSFDLFKRFSPLVRYSPFRFSYIVGLGFVGVGLTLKHRRRIFSLYGYMLSFFISVVLIFISGRFRLPILAPMSFFAALTFWICYRWVISNKNIYAVMAVASTAIIVALLSSYRQSIFPIRPNDFTGLARYYYELERWDEMEDTLKEGERYYQEWDANTKDKIIAQKHALFVVRNRMARIFMEQGRLEEAEKALTKLAEDGTSDYEHFRMLIDVCMKQGKSDKALVVAEQVARVDPHNPEWPAVAEKIRKIKALVNQTP